MQYQSLVKTVQIEKLDQENFAVNLAVEENDVNMGEICEEISPTNCQKNLEPTIEKDPLSLRSPPNINDLPKNEVKKIASKSQIGTLESKLLPKNKEDMLSKTHNMTEDKVEIPTKIQVSTMYPKNKNEIQILPSPPLKKRKNENVSDDKNNMQNHIQTFVSMSLRLPPPLATAISAVLRNAQ